MDTIPQLGCWSEMADGNIETAMCRMEKLRVLA